MGLIELTGPVQGPRSKPVLYVSRGSALLRDPAGFWPRKDRFMDFNWSFSTEEEEKEDS